MDKMKFEIKKCSSKQSSRQAKGLTANQILAASFGLQLNHPKKLEDLWIEYETPKGL